MHRSLLVFLLFATPALAHAQPGLAGCSSAVLPGMPVRPTITPPLAIELSPASTQLGNSASVLGQAFDEALSVDSVLLRIKLEGCQATANIPAGTGVTGSDDPAAYKPRTEFDNTPWRFNMNQNGKNMTADEFSAWMKSRGVRVATGVAPAQLAPPPTPAADATKE